MPKTKKTVAISAAEEERLLSAAISDAKREKKDIETRRIAATKAKTDKRLAALSAKASADDGDMDPEYMTTTSFMPMPTNEVLENADPQSKAIMNMMISQLEGSKVPATKSSDDDLSMSLPDDMREAQIKAKRADIKAKLRAKCATQSLRRMGAKAMTATPSVSMINPILAAQKKASDDDPSVVVCSQTLFLNHLGRYGHWILAQMEARGFLEELPSQTVLWFRFDVEDDEVLSHEFSSRGKTGVLDVVLFVVDYVIVHMTTSDVVGGIGLAAKMEKIDLICGPHSLLRQLTIKGRDPPTAQSLTKSFKVDMDLDKVQCLTVGVYPDGIPSDLVLDNKPWPEDKPFCLRR